MLVQSIFTSIFLFNLKLNLNILQLLKLRLALARRPAAARY